VRGLGERVSACVRECIAQTNWAGAPRRTRTDGRTEGEEDEERADEVALPLGREEPVEEDDGDGWM